MAQKGSHLSNLENQKNHKTTSEIVNDETL